MEVNATGTKKLLKNACVLQKYVQSSCENENKFIFIYVHRVIGLLKCDKMILDMCLEKRKVITSVNSTSINSK